MNVFALFERRIVDALERQVAAGKLPAGLDLSRIVVEPPRDPSHGDLATNAAMAIAKAARMSPRAIADLLVEDLRGDPAVTEASVAGPGFINLRIAPNLYHDVIRAAVADPEGFGRSRLGGNKPVNVEYVSANPTGPLHVGHGRGAVFGDALSALLAFAGHAVTREYYINDAGAQVDVLARSAYLRYREALGEEIGDIPQGLYPGAYLVEVGEALKQDHGDTLVGLSEAAWLPKVRDYAIGAMMELIRRDLAMLGIEQDVFFSELSLSANPDRIAATIADLRVRNLVYEGRLPPPKGQTVEDWEDREQTLFRATEFGDDVDRALLKSDGAYTYFASDIAYHRSKFERGFNEMIDVWGADHGGYVKRMTAAAVKAVSAGKAELDVKLCQLVRLLRDGEPVKMSKRAGDFVTLRDVVEEVGPDPVRFMMLFRKNDAPLDFDLAKVVEQSKDNPVFYVQYAHARTASVFRQAAETLGLEPTSALLATADLALLADESETELQRRIAQYPRVVEAAALAHEPHRVAFYLYDLAALFHALWNKGKDLPQLRFVKQGDESSTMARLALVGALKGVLASGLGILGVKAPEEMR